MVDPTDPEAQAHGAGYYDVYILAPHRSSGLAAEFLDAFAPRREQSSEDYIFPPCSGQPERVVTAAEAIRICDSEQGEEQGLYFRNLGPGPVHVMLFFTSDGGLILGLSVPEGQQANALDRLRSFIGAGGGYIDFEAPPPCSMVEFRRLEEFRSEMWPASESGMGEL